MKNNLIITLVAFSTALLFAGCAKSHKSTNQSQNVNGSQASCSQSTIDLHANVLRKSEQRTEKPARYSEIHQSCVQIYSEIGNNYCRTADRGAFISYGEISDFCKEMETYSKQNPAPSTSKGRTLVRSLNNKFGIYFKKAYLEPRDLDLRSKNTNCKITLSGRVNGTLLNTRATIGGSVGFKIYNGSSGRGAAYHLIATLDQRRELIHVACSSLNQKMTLQDLNTLLYRVAEIR